MSAFREPRVSQAAGMVSVQARCSLEEALVLLQDRAVVTGETLSEIADATVEREISFGPAA